MADLGKREASSTVRLTGDDEALFADVEAKSTGENAVHVITQGFIGTQEHQNGSVTTAGTPVTITPASGNIRAIIVQNPSEGANANVVGEALLISQDGGTTYFSIPFGGFYTVSETNLASVKIDTNVNGTNYEILLEHD
jgi:hypothetical protein